MARKDSRKRQNEVGTRGPAKGTVYLSTSDPTRRQLWLKAYRESGGSYAAACRASAPHLSGDSINPPGYSSWKGLEARDPQWAALVEETRQIICDDIEEQLHTLSMHGLESNVWQKATQVFNADGTPAKTRKISESVLLRRAAALMPEKYRDAKNIDVTHTVNRAGAWTITAMDLDALSDSEQDALASIMAKVRSHRNGADAAPAITHQPADTLDAEFTEVDDDDLEKAVPW